MISSFEWKKDQGTNWFEESGKTDKHHIFVIATYGSCLYWINGEKLMLSKGQMLFIPQGCLYYGKSIPTVFHEKLTFQLKLFDQKDRPATEILPLLKSGSWIISTPGFFELAADRIRQCVKELEDGTPYASHRMTAALWDALALWCRDITLPATVDIVKQHAEKMKKFIQENYRKPINKHDLGDCIGRSPNYAASLFQKATQQTISSYVHTVRMKTAVYLLQHSLLNISEIAEYTGYQDTAYFQRIFKKTVGTTPSTLLKERPKQL